jgi:hypothetical protein
MQRAVPLVARQAARRPPEAAGGQKNFGPYDVDRAVHDITHPTFPWLAGPQWWGPAYSICTAAQAERELTSSAGVV